MQLLENIPLAPLTTFKIGGPARYFVEARDDRELQKAVAFASSRSLPLFVLGGGSNLLVADAGWPGLVLKIAIQGIEQRSGHNEDGNVIFDVGAGESWDKFVSRSVMARCAGVECLSGIPGSVGGTPVQNVGAYGQEVSETIASVQVLDLRDGQVRELCNEACGFGYRSSIFNTSESGRFIVLRVTYALTPGGKPANWPMPISSATSRAAKLLPISPKLARRCAIFVHLKGMLIVPGDPDCQSAGSFFKNPVLTEDQHEDLGDEPAARGLTVPSYPALVDTQESFGGVVGGAFWIRQRITATGEVAISSKHALAIVNHGGATAADDRRAKRTDSAARGRNLGRASGAGAGDGWPLS